MHAELAVRQDRRPTLVRPWLGAAALALAAACTDGPTAPAKSAVPAAVSARPATGPSRYITGGGSQLTFVTDSGTFTLDVSASELRTPQGQRLPLAPDAVAYFRDAWQSLRTTDSIVNVLSTARSPSSTCNPRIQNCGPATPLRVRPGFGLTGEARMGGGVGVFAAAGTPVYSTAGLPLEDIPNFSCRDISRAMYDLKPAYQSARKLRENALEGLRQAAQALLDGFSYDPVTKLWIPPGKPRTIAAIRQAIISVGRVAQFELAESAFQYYAARLGVLGTMFNLNDCLRRPWDPDPNLPAPPAAPSPGGGGGTGGNAGGLAVCYYRVTTIDGIVVSRVLWYCRAL